MKNARVFLGFASFGALAAYFLSKMNAKKTSPEAAPSTPPTPPAADAPHPSGLSKEEIEGKPELIAKAPAGYTRNIGKLPPEANSFARQGLSLPYGGTIGPKVLSDGRSYIGVAESHFDDHVTNPRTGQKDKHWHKGVSLFVQA